MSSYILENIEISKTRKAAILNPKYIELRLESSFGQGNCWLGLWKMEAGIFERIKQEMAKLSSFWLSITFLRVICAY